ncbi:hypothetical protein RN001_007575 [Aquatica leii]|uniref:Neprilysin n=1 Tax=Aquatica leii TaxID=1421715 RepID=A0AAN7P8Y0_9COLE|nr:hypothetical protein RN001_007575 [Aquatica leii]
MKNEEQWIKKKSGMAGNHNNHQQEIFVVQSYFNQPDINMNSNTILDPKKSKVNNQKIPQMLTQINIGLNKHWKFFTFGIFLVMLTILVISIVILTSKNQNNEVCLSSNCIEAASKSFHDLDITVDPCVDFYTFACGNFIKEAKLRGYAQKSSFSEIFKDVDSKLENLIYEYDSNSAIHPNVKKLFDICMEYKFSSDKEIKIIKSIIDSLGGWPMIMENKWNENNFDLLKFMLRLKELGIFYNHLLYFTIEVNYLEASKYILHIVTELPQVIDARTYKFITDIALKLGSQRSTIDAYRYKYVELRDNLINIYSNMNMNPNRYIIINKISNETEISWSAFLNRLIDDPNVNITEEDIIIGKYSKRLVNFIKYIFRLPKSLPLIINSLYVRKYFDIETKTIVENIVYDIRDEFMKILETLNWLDDKTRKNAIQKLSLMKICVGYPNELLDDVAVNNFYKNLTINFTTYLSAIMSINIFEFRNTFKRLKQPVKNCYWIDRSLKVTMINAVYYPTTNGIQIPAAFLQGAVFDKYRPNYMNYATAGMIIGHEITHGFDNRGGLFDSEGNYKEWWSNDTLLTFKQKAQCIIDQYDQYKMPQSNTKVNGYQTLAENIADNGGLKHSFLAYTNWVKKHGSEKMLPGLNYTTNQMFWIAFAQFWCTYTNPDLIRFKTPDPHSPDMFRVIGTLSNSKDFSADFNCPFDSPMNPKVKCGVWVSVINHTHGFIHKLSMENKEKWVKKKNEILPLYSNNSHLARPFTVHSYLTQPKTEIKNDTVLEERESQVNNTEIASAKTQICRSINKFGCKIKEITLPSSRWFTISVYLVMLIVIIVLIIIITLQSSKKELCLSSTCLQTAYKSLKYLDSTVDPCVDFYTFACGNFLKEMESMGNASHRSPITSISETVSRKLDNLINGYASLNASKSYPDLKKIFNACMTYQSNSDKEVEHIKSILDSLGGWPMVMDNKWNESNFDLKEFILRLKKLGISYQHLFYFDVDVNRLHTDRYTIFYFNVKSNNYVLLKSISNTTGIDWSVFLNRLIDDTNITVTGNELVMTTYVKELIALVKYIFQIPKRVIANYFIIEVLLWMNKYLPGLQYIYEGKVPSHYECVSVVTKSLPLMINSLYVKNYFDVETKTKIEKIVYDIRDEFMKIIETLDWLDENTRKYALLKLSVMKVCVGYPNELLDDIMVNNFYKQLNINFTTYLSAIMSINAFDFNRMFKRLRQPVKNCYWIDTSERVTIVNAEYYCLNNGIRLPAAFFQGAVFDKYRPNYINYATAGMVIGHEMTHGFDNHGKDYDNDGNFIKWWSNETLNTFKTKAQCIVDQYGQYLVPKVDMNINGQQTLGENIADNGGLKQSFLAYKNWAKRNGPEKMLPGLNYTTNQMFWIAFAQFWCSYERLDYKRYMITNVHAPSMFRVIGTLSNIESFSKDFKCRLGSPMNPKKKCNVW